MQDQSPSTPDQPIQPVTPTPEGGVQQPANAEQPVGKKRKLHPRLAVFVLLPLLALFLLAALAGKFLFAPTESRPLAVLPQPTKAPLLTEAPTISAVEHPISTNPGSVVVSINRHGGLCRTGQECNHTVAVMQDKSIMVDGMMKTKLSDAEYTSLSTSIAALDFVKVKEKKFTGTCPVAYDGSESIYTFSVGNGSEVIKSCETEIDTKTYPIFSTLDTIFDRSMQ